MPRTFVMFVSVLKNKCEVCRTFVVALKNRDYSSLVCKVSQMSRSRSWTSQPWSQPPTRNQRSHSRENFGRSRLELKIKSIGLALQRFVYIPVTNSMINVLPSLGSWTGLLPRPTQPSFGKWVPASPAKVKAGMVHSVSRWTWDVQVKLWDSLRERMPYLSRCDHDKVLYKSTFTFTFTCYRIVMLACQSGVLCYKTPLVRPCLTSSRYCDWLLKLLIAFEHMMS